MVEDHVQVSANAPSVHWNNPDPRLRHTHLKKMYVNRRNAVELSTIDVSVREGIVTEV